jgi:hypothetical protein
MAFGRPCRVIAERVHAEKDDTEFQKVMTTLPSTPTDSAAMRRDAFSRQGSSLRGLFPE